MTTDYTTMHIRTVQESSQEEEYEDHSVDGGVARKEVDENKVAEFE